MILYVPLAPLCTHTCLPCGCLQAKNSPEGLVGVQRRFVKFGGGASKQQLEWLQQELQVCVQTNGKLPHLGCFVSM